MIFNRHPNAESKDWKAANVKIKKSQVYECKARTGYRCTGKFIKTKTGQENCLFCGLDL